MSWRWFATEKPSAGSPPICRSGRSLTGLPDAVSWSFALEAAPARSSGTPCCALMTALLRKPSVLLPAATTSSSPGFPTPGRSHRPTPAGESAQTCPTHPSANPSPRWRLRWCSRPSDPVVAEQVTLVRRHSMSGSARVAWTNNRRGRGRPRTPTLRTVSWRPPVTSSIQTTVGRRLRPARSRSDWWAFAWN